VTKACHTKKNHFVRGSLYIEFVVDFPKNGALTLKHKQALLKILPPPEREPEKMEDVPPPKKLADDEDGEQESETQRPPMFQEGVNPVEEATMQDVDMNAEKRRMAEEQKEQYEENEADDDHRHGRRVQTCQSQ